MVYKRQAEDRAAELKLRDEELAAAHAEVTVLTETQAQLEQAAGAAEQLQAQVRVQEAQSKETLDHIGRIEAARDVAQTQVGWTRPGQSSRRHRCRTTILDMLCDMPCLVPGVVCMLRGARFDLDRQRLSRRTAK